ncbi:hypothetical protein [Actinomycetospora termitidis]|uniref:Uncharacterized protein n=1 Tax=Actinomycetospora termitidis TaxID=3053470 RepID=A0ABT7MG59_9PSEU|nr:hypothetical protein [Actinomycetospora sp. Odt1-22]MDL5159431.1 hypothetical protein [Actinomycetospora sp. Odt1-22]
MTFIELVHSVVPGLTDAEADHVLWEYTPFPCTTRPDELMPFLIAHQGEVVARSTHLGALT